jgi:hypothetical protein
MVLSWPFSRFSSLMFCFAVFPHSSSTPRKAPALLISSTSGPGLAANNNTGTTRLTKNARVTMSRGTLGAGEVKIQTNDFVKECGGELGRGKKAERASERAVTGPGRSGWSKSDQRGKSL